MITQDYAPPRMRNRRMDPSSSCSQVLALLETHDDGMTCEELERFFPEKGHQSVSARLHELKSRGRARTNGSRRANRTGRKALVWFFVPAATAVAPVRRDGPMRVAARELRAALGRLVEAHGKGAAAVAAAIDEALAVLPEADRILTPAPRDRARREAAQAAAALREASGDRIARHATSH